MKSHILLVVAVAVVVSQSSLSAVPAQVFRGGVGNDNPNGPTVSPYLNLLQNNNRGITNYQSLVKPLINQNDALRRQGGAIQQLQQQQYQTGGGRGTGVHSYFMYYSHFYQPGR